MEAIGQLTGGIAHDFNNLLMAVLGSLQLLRKRLPDDARMRALLENAHQGAQRGVGLTQRMLAFARRQELKPQIVHVPELVRGMNDLIERSIGSEISVETRFPLKFPPIKADANQLEAAFLNLVVNARDAMSQGGTIIVSARAEHLTGVSDEGLKAGHYVALIVTDEGDGMDDTTVQRAIEPFFTTKGVGKGTGLGLSMVQGMAAQSGGRFLLSSKMGVGTTAEIWLPVAEPEAPDANAAADLDPDAGRRSTVRNLRVLAVDDDALVLLNTAGMLEDLGHKVFQAISAQDALEVLRAESPIDLVITDQSMPRMTGHQLAAQIKIEWPDLPVIIATGYAELSADIAGDLPRLGKPFGEWQLRQVIDDVFEPSDGSKK